MCAIPAPEEEVLIRANKPKKIHTIDLLSRTWSSLYKSQDQARDIYRTILINYGDITTMEFQMTRDAKRLAYAMELGQKAAVFFFKSNYQLKQEISRMQAMKSARVSYFKMPLALKREPSRGSELFMDGLQEIAASICRSDDNSDEAESKQNDTESRSSLLVPIIPGVTICDDQGRPFSPSGLRRESLISRDKRSGIRQSMNEDRDIEILKADLMMRDIIPASINVRYKSKHVQLNEKDELAHRMHLALQSYHFPPGLDKLDFINNFLHFDLGKEQQRVENMRKPKLQLPQGAQVPQDQQAPQGPRQAPQGPQQAPQGGQPDDSLSDHIVPNEKGVDADLVMVEDAALEDAGSSKVGTPRVSV